MKVQRIAWLLALIALSAVSAASAQDLEVFDLETFLDPRVLTFTDESGQVHDLAFFAVYLRTGFSSRFQYRSEYLRSDVGLVDATGTFVQGRLQLTGRMTGYGYGESGIRSSGRAEARAGYYFVSPESTVIKRLELSLGRTTASRQLGGTVFGADLDVSAPIPYDVIGSFSYAYFRPDRKCRRGCAADDSEPAQSLSASIRTETWEPDERVGLDAGAGVGVSYLQSKLRWDTLRFETRLRRRSPEDRWSVYGVYAPAYRLGGGVPGSRLNHEISVFFHLSVWSRAEELFGGT